MQSQFLDQMRRIGCDAGLRLAIKWRAEFLRPNVTKSIQSRISLRQRAGITPPCRQNEKRT
jgi:hypothetical protein